MDSDARGLFQVTYRDNMLAHANGQFLVAPHGMLQEVATRLYTQYKQNNISYRKGLCGDYLITGVLVKVESVGDARDMGADQLSLYGENRTSLEFLARGLGLPDKIQDHYFRLNPHIPPVESAALEREFQRHEQGHKRPFAHAARRRL